MAENEIKETLEVEEKQPKKTVSHEIGSSQKDGDKLIAAAKKAPHDEKYKERFSRLQKMREKYRPAMEKFGKKSGAFPTSSKRDAKYAKSIGFYGEPEGIPHTYEEIYDYALQRGWAGDQAKHRTFPGGYYTYKSMFPEGEDKERSDRFNRWRSAKKPYYPMGGVREGTYINYQKAPVGQEEGFYLNEPDDEGNISDIRPISERVASELFESDYEHINKGNQFINDIEGNRKLGEIDEDASFALNDKYSLVPAEEGYLLATHDPETGEVIKDMEINADEARALISTPPHMVDDFANRYYTEEPLMEGRKYEDGYGLDYYRTNWHSPVDGKPMKQKPKEEVKEEVEVEEKPVEQKPEEKPEQKPEEKPAEEKRPDDWGEKGEIVKPKTGHQRAMFNRAMKSKTKEEGKRILEKFAYEFLIPYFVTQFVPMI